MGLRNFFQNIFFKEMEGFSTTSDPVIEASIFYKEFAIQTCISLITNALCMSEFDTYRSGKKVKENSYYAFNIEPNVNQNASEFWSQAITNLIYTNECLIVQLQGGFYVADYFTHNEKVFYPDTYTNVVVRGYPLTDTFQESDVFYFKLNDGNIKALLDSLYKDYSNVLGVAMDAYSRLNAEKGILHVNGIIPPNGPIRDAFDNLMNNDFRTFFNSNNAVLPLQNGYKYEPLNKLSATKQSNTSRDIKSIIDDIFEFASIAIHVPKGVFKGDVVDAESQTNNFLMFTVNPIAKIIKNEINRKYYKKNNVLTGTFLKIDTSKIANVNLTTLSNAADILFRTGVNTINDNLELLGREPINEDWANKHYVTKNYQSIVDMKGGEIDGTENNESTN